jgi:hypothetical protein
VCRVYLQVIDDTLVDRVCLGRRLPGDPVTSRDLPAGSDCAVTPDADPQHRQRAQRRLPPLLRRRTTEEDPDFPELEPPLRTITLVVTAPQYPGIQARPTTISPASIRLSPCWSTCPVTGLASR